MVGYTTISERLLDRGHGKPVQPIVGDLDGPPLAASVSVIIAAATPEG